MRLFSGKKDEIENLKKQLQEQTAKNTKLESDYSQQLKKINNISAENNKLQARVKELETSREKNNSELENKLKNVSAECNKLQTRVKELQISREKNNSEMEKQWKITSEEYNKLVAENNQLQARIKELQTLQEKNNSKTSSKDVSACMPIVYQNTRQTSLEIWIDKLENFVKNKSKSDAHKKEVESAKKRLENCKKGLIGENSLKEKLFELRNKQADFNNMIILQDLCFKSPFETESKFKADSKYRKNVQIDFLVITKFVIFIFDSKYRAGVEVIGNDTHITDNMQEYRRDIMEIISQRGLKEKFGIKESNIYAMLVYSGKNEINHAGFNVKSDDPHSGYCEECDEIQYIFNDNLVDEVAGIYSHAGRKQKSSGFKELSSNDISQVANSILEYISNNGYDPDLKCPLCGKDLQEKTGGYKPFMGCTGYRNGCKYLEEIKK